MIIAPGGSAIVASLMLAFILLTKHRRRQTGTVALDSSAMAAASSAFAAPNQAVPCGPCSPHEWDHTTASAMQGVRGVVVDSPMLSREELSGGGDEVERTEQTPLLSSSYKG